MTAEKMLDYLAAGNTPEDVAAAAVDADVAAGEYEGCSSDLEIAYDDYRAQAQRTLAEAGGA